MNNYNYIINPITNRKINLFSKKGKEILKTYINNIYGGSVVNNPDDYLTITLSKSEIINILEKDINKTYVGKGTNKKVYKFINENLENLVLSLEIFNKDKLDKIKFENEINIEMSNKNIGPKIFNSYLSSLSNFSDTELKNIIKPLVQDHLKTKIITEKQNLYLSIVISEKLNSIQMMMNLAIILQQYTVGRRNYLGKVNEVIVIKYVQLLKIY